MKNKYSIKVIFIVLLSILSIFFVGFKLTTNKTPNELYAVYLEGKKIGVVKSKDEFNKYINKQEETLKTKYQVDNIYTPKGVEIKKIVTYSKKYNSNKEIYDLFYANKDKIEENTGLKYKWQRLDNKKASRIKAIKKCDVTNQEEWEECFKWFCDYALVIKKEFNKIYNK